MMTHGDSTIQPPGRGTAWYTLAILTIVMFVSYVDRFILSVLVQPIKADLGLNDSQIGLLTGFAFSAFYATFGLPMARWADRGSRRTVIAVSLSVWSVMTALCGLCQNFWQLLLARFGVGAGEAGGVPASHSMIADLFPPTFRATALALFSAGGSTGMMLGFTIGAWLEHGYGWRGAFMLVGAPGLLLALLFVATVREPRQAMKQAAPIAAGDSWGAALKDLWGNMAFRHLLFAHAAAVFLSYGQTNWMPAFFERSFGASRVELGSMLAVTRGVGMFAGLLVGGMIADRLARGGMAGPTKLIIWSRVGLLIPAAGVYLVDQASIAYALSAASGFFAMVAVGPELSIMMTIVPAGRRATASAATLFSSSFIGMGGGPLIVGILSDLFAPAWGVESLRVALLIVTVFGTAWGLIHYVLAARYLSRQHDAPAAGLPAAQPA